MRKIFILLLLCTFSLNALAQQPKDWTSLFNGQDLAGWSKAGDSATFTVEEGAIRMHRKANTREHTFLRTDQRYRDFILELECKQEERFQYGILVRAIPAPDTAHVRLYGYQLKFDQNKNRRWTGAIFDDFGNTWRWLSTLSDNPKAQDALKETGLWDHYRFEAIGDTIRIWVNGVAATNIVNKKYREGYIALKIHSLGDNPSLEKPTAWVRNVRIITEDPGRFAKPMDIPLVVVE